MKPIAKRIKGEQQLGLDLYDTGNRDAMYLAGLIVDRSKMTKSQLDASVRKSGGYVERLLQQAKAAARSIIAVAVDMGDTACKTPLATDYIAKVEKMGRVGRKRKTLKC